MTTRLEIDAPDLARSVALAPVPLRNSAALAVVRALLSHFPEMAQQLNELLHSSDQEASTVLAERLDQEYFALDEQRDERAVQRFAEARAAMAVKFALEGSADEALYEAIMALDDGEYVEAIFRNALRNAV